MLILQKVEIYTPILFCTKIQVYHGLIEWGIKLRIVIALLSAFVIQRVNLSNNQTICLKICTTLCLISKLLGGIKKESINTLVNMAWHQRILRIDSSSQRRIGLVGGRCQEFWSYFRLLGPLKLAGSDAHPWGAFVRFSVDRAHGLKLRNQPNSEKLPERLQSRLDP